MTWPRRALPDELYVLELGVGNGSRARTWLDEFVSLDRRHGRDYYRSLRHLTPDVARAKLHAMVAGVAAVRTELQGY